MNKENVLQLLGNIKYNRFVGITAFEVVQYAVNAGLLVRTSVGNFKLTAKGEDLFSTKISWEEAIK
jgi:hypothetical protein